MKLYDNGVYIINVSEIIPDNTEALNQIKHLAGRIITKEESKSGTITSAILNAHNKSKDPDNLEIVFDSLTSHDITYVSIIQTARASGMEKFPMPYVLINCHNSL